jgi:hypothetical protein
MTNAEKIAALEAAKATLEDMIIVTARTFSEFGSAEHTQVGHIAALYQDLTAVDDLLWQIRERDGLNVERTYKHSAEAVQ